MKRVLALIMTTIMLLTLCGCGAAEAPDTQYFFNNMVTFSLSGLWHGA